MIGAFPLVRMEEAMILELDELFQIGTLGELRGKIKRLEIPFLLECFCIVLLPSQTDAEDGR